MDIKYIKIFQSKALPNLPKFGIFGSKTNHLATLLIVVAKNRVLATMCSLGSGVQL
jgi:hypothetical protein